MTDKQTPIDGEFILGPTSLWATLPSEIMNIRGNPISNDFIVPINGVEILKLTPEGMIYKGKLIEDAGEAHSAWMQVMGAMGYKAPLTDDEIKTLADTTSEIARFRTTPSGMMGSLGGLSSLGLC
jgi:hypothetical protein